MTPEEITPEDIASRAKILRVVEQIDSPWAGKVDIECPYCGSFNSPKREFCCELLRKCVITILMGRRNDEVAREIGNHTSN